MVFSAPVVNYMVCDFCTFNPTRMIWRKSVVPIFTTSHADKWLTHYATSFKRSPHNSTHSTREDKMNS